MWDNPQPGSRGILARSARFIRSWMPHQIEVFTSMRLVKVIVWKAESAGSFSPAATIFPSAILIRATGRFVYAASLRNTASAICPA
ncbi:hypothetical protein OG488_25375 [Streptomyces sp. NBC_01460]|uniref:hypothetical protein n=1 Tax=Streptomyces sp. NBC_01460 TaxID=2903875 RepID=UPI002E356080|nr:hypothetical protein [Streptomyces sp. NBC_01460]